MKLRTSLTGAGVALATALSALVAAPAAGAAEPAAVVAQAACTQTSLDANDDLSSPEVQLPFAINFYGKTYDRLYVNNNGNVTFDGPLSTYTPFGLNGTALPIIAPFFADVDTRVRELVRFGYGETVFQGRPAFCVNWRDVGYFDQHTDKTNSFQLLLVSRPDQGDGAFDIVFNYDRIDWETGDASGGSNGLGGSSARAGFSPGAASDGSINATELPGSGVNGSFLDSSPNGLVHGRVGSTVEGRYVFPVRGNGSIAYKYIALGDSFQSGEGDAGNYFPETDQNGEGCHRSKSAYPQRLVEGVKCACNSTSKPAPVR